MKKILFAAPVLFTLNSFSQNILSNINYQQAQQTQSNQVFASNVMTNNANKPLRANANPQVNVLRVLNANQRHQTRRRANVGNIGNVNPVQNNINVSGNTMNNDIQMQGNAFSNESNIIEQLASVNIPAIELGSGSLNLNLDINFPNINLKSIKFSSRKTVSNSKHKTLRVKNKFAKLNRKITGKLSFGKKLKLKVDNCFKW